MPQSFSSWRGFAASAAASASAAAAAAAAAARYSGDVTRARCASWRRRHSPLSQSGLHRTSIVGKKSLSAEYPRYLDTDPNRSMCLSEFCTSIPATIPMVVGSDAAHTPSRFNVFSSIPDATTSGGTHAKHAVSPGTIVCTCPLTASSETPDSIHV